MDLKCIMVVNNSVGFRYYCANLKCEPEMNTRCAFQEETSYILEDSNTFTCQCPSSGTSTLPPLSGEIFGYNSSKS